MAARADRFEQLAEGIFDVLILGGGINGTAAARDAALRGLRVALVEKRDWASGTSSRSAKLVHGGLRYLATFQLGLVRESTAERAVQMKVAPHLVKPLEFLLPVYADHKHGLWFMNLGLWLYDTLALFRVPKRHRMYRGKRTLSLQPNLRKEGLKGALTFCDTATDDARLTLENALDAEALGAVTLNYARVTGLLRGDDGRVTGAEVTDELTGRCVSVHARVTLNTTGPWTDRLLALTGDHEPLLRPTKGAHLVLRAERLPVQYAVGMIHPQDSRPLFVIPWGTHVYVGTTDFDTAADPDEIYCGQDDRDNILEAINHYFPEAEITPKDIVGTWCGLRPLVAPASAMSASKVSREEVVQEAPPGLITMAGGKLTTYRLMAQRLVDRAVTTLRRSGELPAKVQRCQTRNRPLPGAVGLRGRNDLDAIASRLTAREQLTPAVATHLAHTYGARAQAVVECAQDADDLLPLCPPLPYVWAEVDFSVQQEQSCTLEDFFARRTQLSLRDPEGCLDVAGEVATRMGHLLRWDDEQTRAAVEAFLAEVRRTLQCREIARDT
ncbi:MAG: glycerol-3-phosphate dehydrogenase/oxidase [bacterium]